MKKVLALFLAMMMLLSALSIGVSAYDVETAKKEAGVAKNQVVLSFNLNGGTIKGGVRVYEPQHTVSQPKIDANGNVVYDADKNVVYETVVVPGEFKWDENYLENMYYMLPENINGDTSAQTPNSTVRLPNVTAPSGYVFNGWYCVWSNSTHPGNRMYTIPAHTGGQIIEFIADYSLETPEEDEMEGVFNILVKVFGTIVGLLFYSNTGSPNPVQAGMDLMETLLGGLFA